MSDLIDRQQAIEAICMETCGASLRNERCMVHCTEVQAVEKLPPAQPERINGHWIIRETSSGDTEARCSHCGFTTLVDEPGNGLHMVSDLNFCPNCGAEMEVTT